MSADRPGVVFVGAGWVTAHRHIPAFKRCGRPCRPLGVIDPHPERAEAVARRHRLPYWGTDLDQPWLDQAAAAAVGTPPAQHAEVTRRLLDRGLHVLCEKPMALSPGEAAGMVRRAGERARTLAVVHNFQFASSVARARRLLDSGRLGELTALYAVQLSNPARRLPTWYRSLPGGLFYDEAPHLLYLLRAFAGDELRFRSVACRREPDAGGEITELVAALDHPRLAGSLTMNFRSPLSEWQLVLVGTRALVAVDIFRDVSVVIPNDRGHGGRDVLRTSLAATLEHLRGVARSGFRHATGRLLYGNRMVARRFLDAADAGEEPDGVSGRDGARVVETLHELLAQAAS